MTSTKSTVSNHSTQIGNINSELDVTNKCNLSSNVFSKYRLCVIKKAGIVYINALFSGNNNASANVNHNVFGLPSSALPKIQIDGCCAVQNGSYIHEGNGIVTISTNGEVNVSTDVSCASRYIQFSLSYPCKG